MPFDVVQAARRPCASSVSTSFRQYIEPLAPLKGCVIDRMRRVDRALRHSVSDRGVVSENERTDYSGRAFMRCAEEHIAWDAGESFIGSRVR